MKILILDNYDSFTYNLALMVRSLTGAMPDVKRNDAISLAGVDAYDKILLSPGPGLPADAGILCELIRQYAPAKSILGICLGHQAIGQVFGASLQRLDDVCHGIATPMQCTETDTLFDGLDHRFEVGRYHSWVVAPDQLPDCLEVTATDDKGQIMALRHRAYDVKGLQFHPESILTPQGKQLLHNWLYTPDKTSFTTQSSLQS